MKLELKHLSPYLPYKLGFMLSDIGIFNIDSEYQKPNEAYEKLKLTNILISERIEVELEHYNGWGIGFIELEEIKPILRPLSDLTKEIEVNGEKFVPHIKLGGRPNLKDYDIEYLSKNIDNISYGLVSKLIEWHFDVFGLIDKGLAIDINTLNK